MVIIYRFAEHLLKKKLTVIEEFHSHLEPMKFIKPEQLADQVRFIFVCFTCTCTFLLLEMSLIGGTCTHKKKGIFLILQSLYLAQKGRIIPVETKSSFLPLSRVYTCK